MAVLISGGAGYIGSHTVQEFLESGERVIVLDNLSKGHAEAVPSGVTLEKVDLAETDKVVNILRQYNVDAVVHFAASSLVGESMSRPKEYYHNNVKGTLSLLDAALQAHVKYIVFSSTAAVYGDCRDIPITETCATVPTNVYGRTKLMIETILRDYDSAYGLKFCALRYFNAAGAYKGGSIGEDHSPETHLLPIIFQVLLGQRKELTIFGDDYPTPDGTCIRDYIHVTDLANAHVLSLAYLRNGGESQSFNLGNGKGFSVKEVLQEVEKVSGKKVPYHIGERRLGDPPVLIASSEKIMKTLNWKPRYNTLEQIVESAWRWHSSHPDGFKS